MSPTTIEKIVMAKTTKSNKNEAYMTIHSHKRNSPKNKKVAPRKLENETQINLVHVGIWVHLSGEISGELIVIL